MTNHAPEVLSKIFELLKHSAGAIGILQIGKRRQVSDTTCNLEALPRDFLFQLKPKHNADAVVILLTRKRR